MKYCLCLFIAITLFKCPLHSQVISYSKPLENNVKLYSFIGKYKGQVYAYTMQSAGVGEFTSSINIYDAGMELADKIDLPLPKSIFGVQFVTYSDFFYMFYQYQDEDSVVLLAAKINLQGQFIDTPLVLDKTFARTRPRMDNKVYTVITSENKKYITAFKINSAFGPNTVITTLLFDNTLAFRHKSDLFAPLYDGIEFFTEFNVDNDGDIVFVRKSEIGDKLEAARKTALVIKPAMADSAYVTNFVPAGIRVSDVHVKIDNLNGRYVLAAFYSENGRLNIDGLYCFVFNKKTHTVFAHKKIILNDSLRKLTDQPGNLKKALNDYSIQNITLRHDGGIIVDAGSFSINPTPTSFSVWNQLYNFSGVLPSGYVFYLPSHIYPWLAWSTLISPYYSFIGSNIVVFSLDSSASTEWVRVLDVSQTNSDHSYIGYAAPALNGRIYYIHNQTEKRTTFLSAQLVDADGGVNGTMFRDIDKTIEDRISFIPRSIVQVSENEILIGCKRRGRFMFAKIFFRQ